MIYYIKSKLILLFDIFLSIQGLKNKTHSDFHDFIICKIVRIFINFNMQYAKKKVKNSQYSINRE